MNVLMIHVDQMRFDAMGLSGNPAKPTPNIDSLAEDGCYVSRHMVTNTVCMPSRVSLITGLYPSTHGVTQNGIALNRHEYAKVGSTGVFTAQDLIKEPLTIADYFHQQGFRTAAFGKLHLTPHYSPEIFNHHESEFIWKKEGSENWHGPYYGFEYVDFAPCHFENPGYHYDQFLKEHDSSLAAKVHENEAAKNYPIEELQDLFPSVLTRETHPSQWLADQCCDYMKERVNNKENFFAFVGIPDPHHPFIPLQEDLDALQGRPCGDGVNVNGETRPDLNDQATDIRHFSDKQRELIRRYTDAMIYTLDQAVGTMIAQLKDLGIWDNTIIVFTSDHGDFLCDHGRLRKSHRGARQLLQVPCLVRDPQKRLPNELSQATSNTDLFPTLCEICDIPIPNEIQGISWLTQQPENRAVISQMYGNKPDDTNLSITDQRYRYGVFPNTGQRELFDHKTDPLECKNIADFPESEEICNRLQRELEIQSFRVTHPVMGRTACW